MTGIRRAGAGADRAQSLVEVMVAVIFLAAGGLAIYTASIRSVSEAAWGAERVMAEGLVNDMIEYYRSWSFTELEAAGGQADSGVKEVSATAKLDDVLAGPEPQAEMTALADQLVVLDPLYAPPPPLIDPPPALPANIQDEIRKIAREWTEIRNVLGLRRMAFYRPDKPGERGTLICAARWKSRAGQTVTAHRQIVRFNPAAVP
jgi:hypothetical protein